MDTLASPTTQAVATLRALARQEADKTGQLQTSRVWWVNRDNEIQDRSRPFGNDYAAAVCQVSRKDGQNVIWSYTIDEASAAGLLTKSMTAHETSLLLACVAESYALSMAFPETVEKLPAAQYVDGAQSGLQVMAETDEEAYAAKRRRGRPPGKTSKARTAILARHEAAQAQKARELNGNQPPPIAPLETEFQ